MTRSEDVNHEGAKSRGAAHDEAPRAVVPGGHALLRMVGEDLDAGRAPHVYREGVIWPTATLPAASTAAADSDKGVMLHGEAHTGARDAPGPRPQPAGADGPAAGARERSAVDAAGDGGPSGPAAPQQRLAAVTEHPFESRRRVLEQLDEHARQDLVGALTEYPQLGLRLAPPGAWLSGVVRPIVGLHEAASLTIAYPLDRRLPVRIWAWWDVGVWIGPRHTNRDGDACVYEPADPAGSWDRDQPLLALLDMASLWVARQLHLRTFGRWPGAQILHTAIERLELHRPGELCGCGSFTPYTECHGPADAGRTEQSLATELGGVPPQQFRALLTERRLPRTVAGFERVAAEPPAGRFALLRDLTRARMDLRPSRGLGGRSRGRRSSA